MNGTVMGLQGAPAKHATAKLTLWAPERKILDLTKKATWVSRHIVNAMKLSWKKKPLPGSALLAGSSCHDNSHGSELLRVQMAGMRLW